MFNRADRPPPWETRPSSDDPFPVVLVHDPPALAGLVAAVRKHATAASPFIMLEQPIDGTPYQIVAHALFASGPSHALLGFMAFTVNEQWLHAQYFDPLVEQVAKIGGGRGGLSITVSDDEGRAVTKAAPVEHEGAGDLHTRFPLLFIDPALVRSISSRPTRVREWTVHVRSLPDQALLATLQGARRMFILISIAAGASLLALVLTVRADRASAALASMKSDFVAAVTHELKTPVAFIRLVGDTLANGRYTSPKTVQEYAGLLSVEASRLEQLDRQPPDLRALQQFACGVGDRACRRRAGRSGRGRAAGSSAGAGQPGVRSGRRRATRSPADLRRSARDDSGARQHRGQRDQVLDDREAPGRERPRPPPGASR